MPLDRIKFLERSALLQNISHENLVAIEKISLLKTFKKKEILFREDEEGVAVFILLQGSVELYKLTPDGRENVIKVIKEGEMFAEAILFEMSRYPVSARALNGCRALLIPKRDFLMLLEHSSFRDDFLAMMMKKVRYLTNQINYLSSFDVEERLFLFLAEQYGQKNDLEINISKKDIAGAIRTTPETLSRLINRLKSEGKLQWQGKNVKVSDSVWLEVVS